MIYSPSRDRAVTSPEIQDGPAAARQTLLSYSRNPYVGASAKATARVIFNNFLSARLQGDGSRAVWENCE